MGCWERTFLAAKAVCAWPGDTVLNEKHLISQVPCCHLANLSPPSWASGEEAGWGGVLAVGQAPCHPEERVMYLKVTWGQTWPALTGSLLGVCLLPCLGSRDFGLGPPSWPVLPAKPPLFCKVYARYSDIQWNGCEENHTDLARSLRDWRGKQMNRDGCWAQIRPPACRGFALHSCSQMVCSQDLFTISKWLRALRGFCYMVQSIDIYHIQN